MKKVLHIIKNIFQFQIHDWKHVFWLFRKGMKNLFLLNLDDAKGSFFWIKMHFLCCPELVKEGKE